MSEKKLWEAAWEAFRGEAEAKEPCDSGEAGGIDDGDMKFACPCCGQMTMDEQPPGTYQVCPVCGWEDDKAQFKDPDYAGGANVLSLNQAREKFKNLSKIMSETETK